MVGEIYARVTHTGIELNRQAEILEMVSKQGPMIFSRYATALENLGFNQTEIERIIELAYDRGVEIKEA